MSENELAAPRSESARRVALLARPGQARDQLRQALEAAAALIVLEDDPNTLQCADLQASAPQVVLVALEPATEESLARFDAVLNDPAVAVIYDEAELAARREGWDAQRWARHLRAKLYGHDDVLPPGGEPETAQPEPGKPASPAQMNDGARIEMHLEQAQGRAGDLPLGGVPLVENGSGGNPYQDLDPDAWQPPGGTAASEQAATGPEPEASTTLVRRPLVLELEAADSTSAAAASGDAHAGYQSRRGAILLCAGIGGPDAVRKVLAALPADLSRPVLVQLRLDGGRYDNLVKQMARVSVLPVELAVAGRQAHSERVYIVPTDVAMHVAEGVVQFSQGNADIGAFIAALPPAESAVLMLSGSDAGHVDAVMALGERGAFVAGQTPQGCYDAAASKALAARGGMTGTPAELAAQAAAHLGT